MAAAAAPLLGSLAGTAGTAAAGTLTIGTIAQVVSTVGSVLGPIMSARSSMQAGAMANQAALMEAQQFEMQREVEKTRAMQEEANRKAKLNQILGAQMAMTAGRGVTIGSGSDIAIADFSEEEAKRESDIAGYDSRARQRMLSMNASNARMSGRASLLDSRNSALSTLMTGAMSIAERQLTS
jgi:hypothetical protein